MALKKSGLVKEKMAGRGLYSAWPSPSREPSLQRSLSGSALYLRRLPMKALVLDVAALQESDHLAGIASRIASRSQLPAEIPLLVWPVAQ